MGHGNKSFFVCTEKEWDRNATFEWRAPFMMNYKEAAKAIAKYLDEVNGYPEERRTFWLLEDGHETPLCVDTGVELVLEYNASIR